MENEIEASLKKQGFYARPKGSHDSSEKAGGNLNAEIFFHEPIEVGIDGLPTDKNIVTLDKHGKILQG